MKPPILIFAIGNESRGDDALAPLLARELHKTLNNNDFFESIEILEEFQLQIEHALDMQNRRQVLFIDAGMDTPAPFAFYPIVASNEPVLYNHALTPEALLKVYRQFHQDSPPESFVLCIKGTSFDLGEPLSAEARPHLAAAQHFAERWLRDAAAQSSAAG